MIRIEVLSTEISLVADRIESVHRAIDRLAEREEIEEIDVGEIRMCVEEVKAAVDALYFSDCQI